MGLSSVLGEGSTFWCEIPFEVSSDVAEAEQPGGAIVDRLRGARVLAVSGETTARRVLCDQLRSWHLEVDVAGDAAAALAGLRGAAVDGRPYVLVVVDLATPDVDGLGLARAIATDDQIRAPVIELSSNRAEDAAAARSSGLSIDVLSKPAHSSRLFETVAAALGVIERAPGGRRSRRRRGPASGSSSSTTARSTSVWRR
jgi:Amt family ammonium transporter